MLNHQILRLHHIEPFKNKISPQLVQCYGWHLQQQLPHFDRDAFESGILAELDKLELKQRITSIADQLHQTLPADPSERHAVIRAIVSPMRESTEEAQSDESGINGWGVLPLTALLGQNGLQEFDESMQLLRELTTAFSSEFDVRFFLIADQPRALAIMRTWLDDDNHHVRRLVSEGTRPRLPWGVQLPSFIEEPQATIPLLLTLRDDPSEYVRRSVANHLNDIAKDHPDLVAELTHEWMQGADKNRERLLRHACRTLIKQGHAKALSAFGLQPPKIELQQLNIQTPKISLGDSLSFDARLRSTSTQDQDLVVDYLLHFKRANGSQSAKVFKWKKFSLAAGQEVHLKKSHALRAVTTRRYYAGEQALSLRINGEDFGLETFNLEIPAE